MTRGLLALAAAVIVTAGCSGSGDDDDDSTPTPSPTPGVVTLQNDDFTAGGTANFQGGFATGEAAAVRLGPLTFPSTLQNVTFLYGGDTATRNITLTIYTDDGAANPGVTRHTADYQVTGSNAAIQEIDLVADNIVLDANETIRVAILAQDDGYPFVAVDSAIIAERNFIYTASTWTPSETLLLPGDFVIRAAVLTDP